MVCVVTRVKGRVDSSQACGRNGGGVVQVVIRVKGQVTGCKACRPRQLQTGMVVGVNGRVDGGKASAADRNGGGGNRASGWRQGMQAVSAADG